MSEQNKNTYTQMALPLVLCVGLAGGLLVGVNFNSTSILFGGAEMQKLREVIGLINKNYVDESKSNELVEEAIQHMLGKLDPHSVYIPANDRVEANEDLRGNYEGIGIEFNIFHDTLTVVSPLSGGPSEMVGLRSGDRIIKVGEKTIAGIGITNADVFKLLKGPQGTEVNIEVMRKSEKINFTIVRDKIPQFSVDAAYMVTAEIGYIKINRFSSTTYEEFSEELSKLKNKGMKKLVVDLQGNPGGYMDEAIKLADEFLSVGKSIVFTKGKNSRFNQNSMSTDKGNFESGDLIILVNEGSASASEILAGALQDNDRAIVVGRRSFGKGLVQNPFSLNDGSELRLTISRYYTPSGRSIQKPYEEKETYNKEIAMRYKRGEFFHADSIKFNDSLRYKTTGGRYVYGGGGIMPDYFVPLDTLFNSHYLNLLYNSNSIQEFTFNYAEENRQSLEKAGLESFLVNFLVTDEMLNNLAKVGKNNGVAPDYKAMAKNKMTFQVHVKAQIARKIWKNNGFYSVLNQLNESFQQAIKLFDKAPELNRNKL